jgi:glycerol-3-phosphate cytidylyltransferase
MKKRSIIGYTSGVFDLFHIGHVNILRQSKALCDKLIVGVSTDELVYKYKNKYPVIPEKERLKIIKSIKFVNHAIYQDSMDKFINFKKLNFDIMFVGDDWYNNTKWNKLELKFNKLGVKIIYFPYTKSTSSTKINKILDSHKS